MPFRFWRGRNAPIEKRGEQSIAAMVNGILDQIELSKRSGNEHVVPDAVESLRRYLSDRELETGLSPKNSYNLHRRCGEFFIGQGQFRNPDLAYSELKKAAEIAHDNRFDGALLADVGQRVFDMLMEGEAEKGLSVDDRAKLCDSLTARYRIQSTVNVQRVQHFYHNNAMGKIAETIADARKKIDYVEGALRMSNFPVINGTPPTDQETGVQLYSHVYTEYIESYNGMMRIYLHPAITVLSELELKGLEPHNSEARYQLRRARDLYTVLDREKRNTEQLRSEARRREGEEQNARGKYRNVMYRQ